jgi:RNA polymerase sigma-70 factor (ECF subfamily)
MPATKMTTTTTTTRKTTKKTTARSAKTQGSPALSSATIQKHELFEELLKPLEDRLYRFARHLAWDPSEAEDLLQDAVIIAYRKLDHFKPGTNFRAWVFQIVAHTAANKNRSLARRRKRQRELGDIDPAGPRTIEGASWLSPRVQDKQTDVLEQVDERLKSAILELPQTRRMAFLLRAIEGFRYREIAEMLDIPLGTVMSHLSRARQTLAKMLAPQRDLAMQRAG